MRQGCKNPVFVLGAIPVKAFLDDGLINEWRANADSPTRAAKSYPGANGPYNHDAMPYMSSFGNKGVRGIDGEDLDSASVGVVALCGLYWEKYCTQRHMEDDFWWQGIVTTESRISNPMDGTTGDPPHGYGMVMAGTHSVVNNGPRTFYPGVLIAWRFPPAPFKSYSNANGNETEFNGGSAININARHGEPPTQWTPQYVPFDPTDFSSQVAAAFASITTSSAFDQDGISDMPYTKALPHLMGDTGCRPWSNIQDEAISYKYGLAAPGLTMVETLLRRGELQPGPGAGNGNAIVAHQQAAAIADKIGLFDTDDSKQDVLREFLADFMLQHISYTDTAGKEALDRFEEANGGHDVRKVASSVPDKTGDTTYYASLRAHGVDILLQGITSSWHSKTSKIVGRATNTAATKDTLDALWGHFKL